MHNQRLIEFSVFNRWGKTMFETTDKTKGWDGTSGGQAQELGVYYYHIIYEELDGTVKNLRGDVTLIR
jgi:gliding motility-associated-like protein